MVPYLNAARYLYSYIVLSEAFSMEDAAVEDSAEDSVAEVAAEEDKYVAAPVFPTHRFSQRTGL